MNHSVRYMREVGQSFDNRLTMILYKFYGDVSSLINVINSETFLDGCSDVYVQEGEENRSHSITTAERVGKQITLKNEKIFKYVIFQSLLIHLKAIPEI